MDAVSVNFVLPYIHCGWLLHTSANTSCLEFSRENRCLPSSILTSERPRRPQREEALGALSTKWLLQGQKQRLEAELLSAAWCGDILRSEVPRESESQPRCWRLRALQRGQRYRWRCC
jgi:hypothetical protein